MSNYRPITDTWILARAKLKDGKKYYGAYPGGFPERARALLGVSINDPVLHVCAGCIKHYPYAGAYGPRDYTLDLDIETRPNFHHDARNPFPLWPSLDHFPIEQPWPAILMDPPYSEGDAEKYAPGADAYPSPNLLVRNAINAVGVGGRVGILHYIWPSPPKNARSVAVVSVYVGFNNRVRCFSVFERTS